MRVGVAVLPLWRGATSREHVCAFVRDVRGAPPLCALWPCGLCVSWHGGRPRPQAHPGGCRRPDRANRDTAQPQAQSFAIACAQFTVSGLFVPSGVINPGPHVHSFARRLGPIRLEKRPHPTRYQPLTSPAPLTDTRTHRATGGGTPARWARSRGWVCVWVGGGLAHLRPGHGTLAPRLCRGAPGDSRARASRVSARARARPPSAQARRPDPSTAPEHGTLKPPARSAAHAVARPPTRAPHCPT